MMWKQCLVLVMLSAWQACTAQELINLVEPQIAWGAPSSRSTNRWEMTDHDKSTFVVVREAGYPGAALSVEVQRPHYIRPTKYRIIVPAHVPLADYPASWEVKGEDSNYNTETLDKVDGAVFTNGEYEGSLSKQINIRELSIRFAEKVVTIAEIELLGPRSALDALWPYGDYPCSQRLAVITKNRGPKKIFSRSKNVVSEADLRTVFNANDHSNDVQFNFDGTKPVLIGAKLPSLPMVHEVSVDASFLEYGGKKVVKKVVLQGTLCENDHCHKLGSKGWVRIGVARPPGSSDGLRIFVKNPGAYKAYRLKFIPGPGAKSFKSFQTSGLFFLGCTA